MKANVVKHVLLKVREADCPQHLYYLFAVSDVSRRDTLTHIACHKSGAESSRTLCFLLAIHALFAKHIEFFEQKVSERIQFLRVYPLKVEKRPKSKGIPLKNKKKQIFQGS